MSNDLLAAWWNGNPLATVPEGEIPRAFSSPRYNCENSTTKMNYVIQLQRLDNGFIINASGDAKMGKQRRLIATSETEVKKKLGEIVTNLFPTASEPEQPAPLVTDQPNGGPVPIPPGVG